MFVKRFPGEINLKGKWVFYGLSLLFIFIGVAINLFDIQGIKYAFNSPILTGGIVGGFGLLVFTLMLSGDLPFLNYYKVEDDGILCCRAVRKKFPYSDIADIRIIKWENLKEMTTESWKRIALVQARGASLRRLKPLLHPQETVDFLKEIPENARVGLDYSTLLSYCTATPATWMGRKKIDVMVKPIPYILMTLTNGKQYVLSPKDPDDFLSLIKKNSASKSGMQ